jgi:hypothetical protein
VNNAPGRGCSRTRHHTLGEKNYWKVAKSPLFFSYGEKKQKTYWTTKMVSSEVIYL